MLLAQWALTCRAKCPSHTSWKKRNCPAGLASSLPVGDGQVERCGRTCAEQGRVQSRGASELWRPAEQLSSLAGPLEG